MIVLDVDRICNLITGAAWRLTLTAAIAAVAASTLLAIKELVGI